MMSNQPTPWWKALQIRPEIISASGQIDDVQMSLADAVYGRGATRPLYAEPEYYGQITHPTRQLVDLLAKLAIRIGGGEHHYTKAASLTRMNQGMGGGKSHAEVGAYHLAAHPTEFAKTDIGKQVWAHAKEITGTVLPADLGHPVVVVLPADQMQPGVPKKELDGPFARNLYERFLWRLFSGDANLYQRYQPYPSDKGKIKEALLAVNRPVLILIDEVMDYVGNGLDAANDQQLTAADMGFLEALADSVNDVPNVAALIVMIDPEIDTTTGALSPSARARQTHLLKELDRNGRNTSVNEDTDFTAILRRRLFNSVPTSELTKATADAFIPVLRDKGWSKAFESAGSAWLPNWVAEVDRSYPFHPQLMHLAEQEWAKHSGYQNVRSTIKVFAATVYALQQRANNGGWAPLLIGPGDLPLWDSTVRENILGSGLVSDTNLEQNFRSIFQGDITTLQGAEKRSGQAALLDDSVDPHETWGRVNPHAHERQATMIAVASLMPRGAGRRGASESEIKIASTVTSLNYGTADADAVLERLTDHNSDKAMGAVDRSSTKGLQPRYYLNPETGPSVIYRQIRQAVLADPERRDDLIAVTAQDMSTTGPFNKRPFVNADRSLPTDEQRRAKATETLLNAGIDDAHSNRLVILDPAGFSLRNGMDEATKAAIEAAMGLGEKKTPVSWASSAVFAVVNTQRRRAVREAAVDLIAWQDTLSSPELAASNDAKKQIQQKTQEASDQLKKNLRRAYQHVLYLSQPTPQSPRTIEELTFDQDTMTALNGQIVWTALAEAQKAFLPHAFNAKALLANLREQDYDLPLSAIRDAFWQAPRLPLLPGGEDDLRQAIFEAITNGDLKLVEGDGTPVQVDYATQINFQSHARRLAPTVPCAKCGLKTCDGTCKEPCQTCGKTTCDGNCAAKHAPCAKCGKTTCDGTCAAVCATCGKTTCDGNCGTTNQPKQKSAKVVLAHDTTDPDLNDQTRAMVEALFDLMMNNSITFIQGSVTFVTDGLSADNFRATVEAAGLTVTLNDLD